MDKQDSPQDTDTLIALVLSLLGASGCNVTSEIVLDALTLCDGKVEEAAQHIRSNREKPQTKKDAVKRKQVDLEGWLKLPSSSSLKKNRKDMGDSSSAVTRTAIAPDKTKSASTKPAVDLMSILRQPSDNAKRNTKGRLPPLMLSDPSLVAQHSPCTLHYGILPPELACRLFYTMVDASRGWSRNKWWLFDRLVESPHRTAFFARPDANDLNNDKWQEAAQYWYNGRKTERPQAFPSVMEEACVLVERIVNNELRKKERMPLEWDGGTEDEHIWKANVAASNCYEGGQESVGFHSDQLTYLGPYPTIASLSLGTRRCFSLREVIPTDQADQRRAQTFNIPLPHNSLTIMHASCQERFKHSIPPQSSMDAFRPAFPKSPGEPIVSSNCRINITFRFYRPDFSAQSIPRCKCGIPTILRPDMKNRSDGKADRYWWSCYAGAQNEGKGCGYWKDMDITAEGRGPCVMNRVQKEEIGALHKGDSKLSAMKDTNL